MVIEPTLSSDWNFSQEERSIVRTQDRPPASTAVVLAAIVGSVPPMQYRCARVKMFQGNVAVFDLHLYTLQLQSLVLQVIRQDPPPPNYGALEGISVPAQLDVPAGTILRIFPPAQQCQWPPKKPLDWNGLTDISRRNLDMPIDWVPPPSPPPSV